MSIALDILLLLIAGIAIFLGFRRGFVKSVMGFVSLILAFVLSYLFTPAVSAWLNEKLIGGWIDGVAVEAVENVRTAEPDSGVRLLIETPNEALEALAERFGFPLDELSGLVNGELSGLADADAAETLASRLAEPTAAFISNVTAAVGLFIAALIVLKLLTLLLDLIMKLPVLDTLNRLLGLLFGVFAGALWMWVGANLAAGLLLVLTTVKPELSAAGIAADSLVISFFARYGLILFRI